MFCLEPKLGYLFSCGFSTDLPTSSSSSKGLTLDFASDLKLLEVLVKFVSFEPFYLSVD